MQINNKDDFEALLKKIDDLKKAGKVDLSTEEDLSIAIMNLVSLEEHFFFTAEKTAKPEYLDVLQQIREIRKNLLGKLISQTEGETWCISKHLLAATMRLIEVGTKLQGDNKKDEAKQTFDYAYRLYNIFWAIRLKLVDLKDVKAMASEDKAWSLNDIVEKMVNCCDE